MVAIDLHLPSDTRSPRAARHSLDGLAARLPDDIVERFRLAVTELVTNAVLHGDARGDLRLRIRVSERVIRVDLTEPGGDLAGPLLPMAPDVEEESGRGLLLVDQAADRWGFSRMDGVRMWFEIDIRDAFTRSYSA